MDWSAGGVHGNAPRHKASRVSVAQAHLQNRGWVNPHHFRVALRKELSRLEVVGERLFEWRSCQPVAHSTREITEIQPLACGIDRAQQPLNAPPQVLRTNQQRLRGCSARLHKTNDRARRQSCKKILVARRIEFLSAIQFQHVNRILRQGVRTSGPRRRLPAAGSRWCLRRFR